MTLALPLEDVEAEAAWVDDEDDEAIGCSRSWACGT